MLNKTQISLNPKDMYQHATRCAVKNLYIVLFQVQIILISGKKIIHIFFTENHRDFLKQALHLHSCLTHNV